MEKYTNFKKKFGQNFLTDTNLLSAIVRDAKVENGDEVLEIGTGEGALTTALALKAKHVVSYEIDTELMPILKQKFETFKNVNIILGDALKTQIDEIESNFENEYKLVANIPYYITTPLIFKFLENSTRLKSMTLMIQKEVAQRICAQPNTESYGALSVICQNFCKCKIERIVNKKLFKPVPKVDSAVITLEVYKKFDKNFSYLVRSAFAMRRKTLVNNLLKAYKITSLEINQILTECEISNTARAESLSCSKFEQLLDKLNSFDKINN